MTRAIQIHLVTNARLDTQSVCACVRTRVSNRLWGRRFVVNQSVNCISGSPEISPAGETIFPAQRYITGNRARSLRARARRTGIFVGSYKIAVYNAREVPTLSGRILSVFYYRLRCRHKFSAPYINLHNF